MVRVRLSRGGAKKRPYYHIVVMDKRDRRDGRCLERIGSYDPSLETQDRIKINMERLDYWVSKGAQISERVKYLKKYSLDPDNIKKREKIKSSQLEKLKVKKLAAAKARETKPKETAEPKEENKVEETAEPKEEVKAEENKVEETAEPKEASPAKDKEK